MKDFPVNLIQNIPYRISYPGTSFHIQEAAAKVELRFDNGDSIIREKTQGGTVPHFNSVELVSTVDQAVIITLGDGQTVDGRAQVVTANVTTTIATPNKVNTLADVTIPPSSVVQVIGSNTNRKKVILFSHETNVEILRVGDALIGAGRGALLAPAGNGEAETESAVYVFNPGTAAQVVSVMELERI